MHQHISRTLTLMLIVLVMTATASAQDKPWDSAPREVPNVTSEMQDPGFWLSRMDNPDAVVLNPGQIARLNRRNMQPPRTITDINGDPYSIDDVIKSKLSLGLQFNVEDPLAMVTFPGDSLSAMLDRHHAFLTGRTWFDRRQIKWPEGLIAQLAVNMNRDAVPGTVTVTHGILVRHTLNRAVPSNEAGLWGASSWLDGWQSTSLDVAMPVAVLHASADGRWLYVRSEIAFGWIPAENVATGDAAEIRRYVEADDFIVATDHTVPIYADDGFSTFLLDLYLGSRVALANQSGAGYRVEALYRSPDGSFATTAGWIRPDASVHVGYQSFTQRNMVETFFRLLFRPYGWADSNHEFDCCGTVRVVLRTFGIKTGRWTSFELHSTDTVNAFPKDTPKERKYEILSACEPGICLVGNAGHINLYIGEVDGSHYVIHQGGYSYTDDAGVRQHVRRVNVNDVELEGGSNIGGWTEITVLKP
jgi:hypothetical protein